MKKKSIMTTLLIGQLCLGSISYGAYSQALSPQQEQAEIEKGSHNGRMLRDGDFAIELAIFEQGVPPEFRVFASKNGQPIAAKDVKVNVVLTRLGDVNDDINFFVEEDYLRGDMEIYEPHSFRVTLMAEHGGERYQWSYDNFEGRTTIAQEMAEAMLITTERVASQQLHETLSVFGKLTIAPNAIRHVSARFAGEVKSLNVALGQSVKKGQQLMTIESNESLQRYAIVAPIDGVITAQSVGVGEQSQQRALLTITDTRELIAELAVFPMDQAKVNTGADIALSVTGSTKIETSKLTDSLYNVNPQQAKIYRAYVNNSHGQYRVGQFVTAKISLAQYQVPRAVKASALQAFRDFTVVYAKVGEQYEVRMLELGRKAGSWVEVLSGINAGDEYVARNSYIIKADIDKSGASHDH